MVERPRTDPELLVIEHHICGHRDRRKRLELKPVAASKQCALHRLATVQLMRQDGEVRRVVLDEIPGVRMQLVPTCSMKSGGPYMRTPVSRPIRPTVRSTRSRADAVRTRQRAESNAASMKPREKSLEESQRLASIGGHDGNARSSKSSSLN
jgi:hypothetical protein